MVPADTLFHDRLSVALQGQIYSTASVAAGFQQVRVRVAAPRLKSLSMRL
jgi:hypothetical protein